MNGFSFNCYYSGQSKVIPKVMRMNISIVVDYSVRNAFMFRSDIIYIYSISSVDLYSFIFCCTNIDKKSLLSGRVVKIIDTRRSTFKSHMDVIFNNI